MTFESFPWSNYSGAVEARLIPTALRLDRIYIRVYILWMNMIVQIVGPFLGKDDDKERERERKFKI